MVVTGAVLIAAAAPAATHWSGSLGFGQAAALKAGAGAGLGIHVSPSAADHNSSRGPAAHSTNAQQDNQTPQAIYANPLRDVTGLVPERIDQGVDFGGAGPVYALGDAIITNATGNNYGWPDGGWITYRLTDGPGAHVRPPVSVGQHVTSKTVIANMFLGNAGIETGWAMASGFTAESQLAEAGGISGAGPFPTNVGLNFEELLQALGVPAANNRYDYPSGVVPSSYPSDWATALGTH